MNNPEPFVTKSKYDDLEIMTLDSIKLYVSKGWLYNLSEFFKKELEQTKYDSPHNTILYLAENAKIIILLFKYAMNGFHGISYCRDECLNKLQNIDDIDAFLSACYRYKMQPIKDACDEYFSSKDLLIQCFGNKLLLAINVFEMNKMKLCLNRVLENKIDLLSLLDYSLISCTNLEVFIDSPEVLSRAFEWWTKRHNPTDAELVRSKLWTFEYSKVSSNQGKRIITALRRFTQAKEFRLKIYDALPLV